MAPKVTIAPTRAEKENAKKFHKQIEVLGSETTTALPDGTKYVISKRNEDYFSGGPLDGHTCAHQPNGPAQSWDEGRFWADYFFRDTMRLDGVARPILGYHIYSSAKSLEAALALEGNVVMHKDHSRIPKLNLGTRTAQMRKVYYYCGFMEDALLLKDGIVPEMFTGVLSI